MLQGHFQKMKDMYVMEAPMMELNELFSAHIGDAILTFDFA